VLAISPDGLKIVFVAGSEALSPLWIRSLDSASARSMAGTEGATYPCWSPNSRSVGFFAQGKLKIYTQEERSGDDLWVLPLDGDRKLRVFGWAVSCEYRRGGTSLFHFRHPELDGQALSSVPV